MAHKIARFFGATRARLSRAWRVLCGKVEEVRIVEAVSLPEKIERSRSELKSELSRAMRAAVERLKGENARANPSRRNWKAAIPAPGVLPEGTMAMDADPTVAQVASWANGNINAAFIEGQTFLGYPYLSELAQRPEYRVISQTWAEEMTRGWIKLVSTGEVDQSAKEVKLKRLEAAMKKFKVREHFRKCLEQDGYFGRAHLYVDMGGDPNDRAELKTSLGSGDDGLSRSKVVAGSLRGFRTVEAVWTYPNGYNANDPLRDDFYRPETWFVMGKEVHRTRMLTFIGRPVPDLLKPMYSFGGLSLSQMAKPYVDNWLRTRQSVSDTLSAFSTMILLTDLSALMEEGAMADLNTRADFYNATRDNRGLMLADKDSEDLKNVAVPLGGLDHLQAQSQEQMSSVSQIPTVKLTGISPTGLNASSEGEIRVFYDKVKSRQEAEVRPPLEIVLDLLQLNEFGEIDPDIGFEFPSLWEPNKTEESTANKTNVDADCALIDRGVLSPQEVRIRIANDPDSPYPSLDTSDDALPEQSDEVEEDAGSPAPGSPESQGIPTEFPAEDSAPSAAGVMLSCKGKVLLMKRASDDGHHPGYWDLPGGMSEDGEDPVETALRELHEEAGIRLRPENLTEVWFSDNGIGYTTFAAEVTRKFKPEMDKEHEDYGWFDAVSVPSPLVSGLEETLDALFAGGK